MAYDTYATLLNKKVIVPSQRTAYVAIDRNFFVDAFSTIVSNVYVDEGWYVDRFPDVGEGIARDEFDSASDHYKKVGFYEHRMPYEIDVDENWYLENYPDIADAVRSGVFASGRAHYYAMGFREGRFPYGNFTLKSRHDN